MRRKARGLAFCLIMSCLLLSACAQMKSKKIDSPAEEVCQVSMLEKPIIVGHRGASGYVPEHTIRAYELALQMGADYIEPDLVMTKDRYLIARHENEISHTTDVKTKFPNRKTTKVIEGKEISGWFSEDFTLAEIKKLRAIERLPFRNQEENGRYEIPSLEEILVFVSLHEKNIGRKIGLIPEIKSSKYFRDNGLAMEESLVALLRKYNRNKKDSGVLIQSFEVENLKRLHRMTDVALVQLIDDLSKSPADSPKLSYSDMLTEAGLANISTYAEWVSPHKSVVNHSVVAQAHAAKLKIIPYTFRSEPQFLAKEYLGDPKNEYKRFYKMGVDGVFSDFPDHAINAWNEFSETRETSCRPQVPPAQN